MIVGCWLGGEENILLKIIMPLGSGIPYKTHQDKHRHMF